MSPALWQRAYSITPKIFVTRVDKLPEGILGLVRIGEHLLAQECIESPEKVVIGRGTGLVSRQDGGGPRCSTASVFAVWSWRCVAWRYPEAGSATFDWPLPAKMFATSDASSPNHGNRTLPWSFDQVAKSCNESLHYSTTKRTRGPSAGEGLVLGRLLEVHVCRPIHIHVSCCRT